MLDPIHPTEWEICIVRSWIACKQKLYLVEVTCFIGEVSLTISALTGMEEAISDGQIDKGKKHSVILLIEKWCANK